MNDALPLEFIRTARGLGSTGSSAKLSGVAVSTGFRYADLFAGIGGFHAMLDHAGGHCVYVSEIDHKARETYIRNWVDPLPAAQRPVVNTDINIATPEGEPVDVPEHDVLAAGFPCQPFSKSGYQRGMDEGPRHPLLEHRTNPRGKKAWSCPARECAEHRRSTTPA